MDTTDFFNHPTTPAHKQYEALRAFYLEGKSATEVAQSFGYTLSSFYSLTRDFKQTLKQDNPSSKYFISTRPGPPSKFAQSQPQQLIIELRKKSLSVPDIKSILDALGYQVSQRSIYNILEQAGFSRLPRRRKQERDENHCSLNLKAPMSVMLNYQPESFNSSKGIGLICLLPYLQEYKINQLIESSDYPQTQRLNRCCSLLSFVALKLSKVRRYSLDDIWCMDRGLGFFAGLNVLPKAAWFTSYSHRVTRTMNRSFLQSLHQCWQAYNLLGDSVNLDFVRIPYWGDDAHLENNWSGSRNQSLASILAVLAQDPDSGIITYGNSSIRHQNQAQVVVEFLDFYRTDDSSDLKYLIFDSKFTTYENLRKLEDSTQPIKFITIRRRGTKIIAQLDALPQSAWKKIRVSTADGRGRNLQVHEQMILLQGYGKEIRQIAILGTRRIKPALIITNDFELPLREIVRKYARRWLVEQEVAEQVHFFHLNRVSSSMVIKVDFDLTMSILAHNIYRLIAADLPGFSHHTAASLFDKFIDNSGKIIIDHERVNVVLKKKRNIPALLQALSRFQDKPLTFVNNLKFRVIADSAS